MGPRFIDQIHGFVRQETFMQIFDTQIDGAAQRFVTETDPVVRFVFVLDPFENQKSLFDTGLLYVHFGEPSGEGLVFVEEVAILLMGRGADTLELSPGQGRFENIGGIHTAAAGTPRSDQRMDLVDEDDRFRNAFELFDHPFEALFEIPPVFGPGYQRSHIQGIDPGIANRVGNLPLGNFEG